MAGPTPAALGRIVHRPREHVPTRAPNTDAPRPYDLADCASASSPCGNAVGPCRVGNGCTGAHVRRLDTVTVCFLTAEHDPCWPYLYDPIGLDHDLQGSKLTAKTKLRIQHALGQMPGVFSRFVCSPAFLRHAVPRRPPFYVPPSPPSFLRLPFASAPRASPTHTKLCVSGSLWRAFNSAILCQNRSFSKVSK